VALLLEHLDNNVASLVQLIASMLARREAWLPVLPADPAGYGRDGEVRAALEATRADVITAHLQRLVEYFPPDLLADLCSYAQGAAQVLTARDVHSPIRACGVGVPGTTPDDVPNWQGLAEFLLTQEDAPRKRLTVSIGVLPQDRKRPELAVLKARIETAIDEFATHASLMELLAETRQLPPVAYEDDEWRVLQSLLLVLRLAAAELKAVFAERKAADYPEFAAAARQSLGTADEPTDTALALDARLQHILVDEFQDTSEAQVQLLERLTAGWTHGDGRTLFAVGDPMQSIYRFRNAEVGLFLDVRDHGLGALPLEPLTLRVNFRSTQPLVEWVNTCFAQVLPDRDDVLSGAVKFADSVPRREAGIEGGVHLHAFLRSSRTFEAQTVGDIVARRLEASGDGRVAILVQGRNHLLDIVLDLTRRGIRFQATDIDPLAQRPVVLDLLALTRALAHLGDRAAWLGVLRAPWCGLRLSDCLALLGDDRDATTLGLLQTVERRERLEMTARARLERCLPVLKQAVHERRQLGLRDAVERAWHALGGPAALADVREIDEARAYLDALGRIEAEAPGAPADLARLGEALQKLYAPGRPHPDTRVELLTIHKSKGLQFDTVIVPGLDRVGRSDSPPLLRWLKLPGQGGQRLLIAPIAPAGSEERNPLHAWLGRLEARKLQHEKRRLLYVAATRAERSLHLLGSCAVDVDKKTGEQSVRRPQRTSALGLLWDDPRFPAAFNQRLMDLGDIAGDPPAAIARDPVLRHLPDGWRVPEPPTAPAILVRTLARSVAETNVEFDWASETARHVGTVVHHELQLLARGQGAVPDGEAVRGALLRRYAAELAELGVPRERRDEAALRVLRAVERTLADRRGQWLLHTPHTDAHCELALTGLDDHDVVNVIIDRTFVDAAGTRWIVDYKTSSHEGAGLDDFLDRERERYRAQLERYARLMRALGDEPIRLGLYFPLLSAWREWVPGA
jgi:ATP-dependent exoDNAse (exonuclease V) beta subunit